MKTFEEERQQLIEQCNKFRDSAYPTHVSLQYATIPSKSYESFSKGFSKRERMATEILTGLLANGTGCDGPYAGHYQYAAGEAVQFADALIAELNREQE